MNEPAEHTLAGIASTLHDHWIAGTSVPSHECKRMADAIKAAVASDLHAEEPEVAAADVDDEDADPSVAPERVARLAPALTVVEGGVR